MYLQYDFILKVISIVFRWRAPGKSATAEGLPSLKIFNILNIFNNNNDNNTNNYSNNNDIISEVINWERSFPDHLAFYKKTFQLITYIRWI